MAYTTEAPSGIPPTVEAQKRPKQRPVPPPSRGTALRIGMLVGGLVLIALFCVPWGQEGSSLLFSWDLMSTLAGLDFVLRIYLAAIGVVMLVAGALPLPPSIRGSIGLLLAGFPLATYMAAHANPSWIVLSAGSLVLAAGLLHSADHENSIFVRVIACVCFVAIVAALVVPLEGGPMLLRFFHGWGAALDIAAHVLSILLILLTLVAIPVVFARLATPARIISVCLMFFAPVDLLIRAMAALQPIPFLNQTTPTYTSLSLMIYCPIGALSLVALFQLRSSHRPAC